MARELTALEAAQRDYYRACRKAVIVYPYFEQVDGETYASYMRRVNLREAQIRHYVKFERETLDSLESGRRAA